MLIVCSSYFQVVFINIWQLLPILEYVFVLDHNQQLQKDMLEKKKQKKQKQYQKEKHTKQTRTWRHIHFKSLTDREDKENKIKIKNLCFFVCLFFFNKVLQALIFTNLYKKKTFAIFSTYTKPVYIGRKNKKVDFVYKMWGIKYIFYVRTL